MTDTMELQTSTPAAFAYEHKVDPEVLRERREDRALMRQLEAGRNFVASDLRPWLKRLYHTLDESHQQEHVTGQVMHHHPHVRVMDRLVNFHRLDTQQPLVKLIEELKAKGEPQEAQALATGLHEVLCAVRGAHWRYLQAVRSREPDIMDNFQRTCTFRDLHQHQLIRNMDEEVRDQVLNKPGAALLGVCAHQADQGRAVPRDLLHATVRALGLTSYVTMPEEWKDTVHREVQVGRKRAGDPSLVRRIRGEITPSDYSEQRAIVAMDEMDEDPRVDVAIREWDRAVLFYESVRDQHELEASKANAVWDELLRVIEHLQQRCEPTAEPPLYLNQRDFARMAQLATHKFAAQVNQGVSQLTEVQALTFVEAQLANVFQQMKHLVAHQPEKAGFLDLFVTWYHSTEEVDVFQEAAGVREGLLRELDQVRQRTVHGDSALMDTLEHTWTQTLAHDSERCRALETFISRGELKVDTAHWALCKHELDKDLVQHYTLRLKSVRQILKKQGGAGWLARVQQVLTVDPNVPIHTEYLSICLSFIRVHRMKVHQQVCEAITIPLVENLKACLTEWTQLVRGVQLCARAIFTDQNVAYSHELVPPGLWQLLWGTSFAALLNSIRHAEIEVPRELAQELAEVRKISPRPQTVLQALRLSTFALGLYVYGRRPK
jgi:hypothetical protein